MKKLAGQTAIVTGAGQGIGKAIALEFAKHGASVMVADFDKDKAVETVNEINSQYGIAVMDQCDVSNAEDVERMVQHAIESMKQIDILVNNAGIELYKPIEEISVEEWDNLMGVNVRGMFLCSKHVVKHMKQRGTGNIINMGSSAGYNGTACQTLYCASKGAVHQFTKALAKECGPAGIKVNAIAAAGVQTPMLDYLSDEFDKQGIDLKSHVANGQFGGVQKPVDIANLAVFLASEESRTIHGTAILIDGGLIAG